MSVSVGIDIGAVSVKAAILGDCEEREDLERLATEADFTRLSAPRPLLVSRYRRALGDPLGTAEALVAAIQKHVRGVTWDRIRVTGRGASLLQDRWSLDRVNEFKAIAAAAGFLYPEVATVFEMGGESSKFLRLTADPESGQLGTFSGDGFGQGGWSRDVEATGQWSDP
jgi:activator of 2-hydroxyglutaryl-CoA dehydratase